MQPVPTTAGRTAPLTQPRRRYRGAMEIFAWMLWIGIGVVVAIILVMVAIGIAAAVVDIGRR
jgi:hypothetical protein